jgi:predicted dehydrogenase
MKAILAGIGNFGRGWYDQIKANHPGLQVVVVDCDTDKAQRVQPGDPFYTSLEEAILYEQPDFFINLTPPHVHTHLNHLAFDRRLPVLCEKPIAQNWNEAVEIVRRAVREKIPFMIAENYRRNPQMRIARKLITQGAIGNVTNIEVQFHREFYEDKAYLLAMANPLLEDVSIHHLDAVRYLSGCEGAFIYAHNFNPKGSRFPGNAAVSALIELTNGVMVSYLGSLAAKTAETGWLGDWRIEGTDGVLLVGEHIHLVRDGIRRLVRGCGRLNRRTCLEEFIIAFRERRTPESSGADYLKTQALVHFALEADRLGRRVAIELPEL